VRGPAPRRQFGEDGPIGVLVRTTQRCPVVVLDRCDDQLELPADQLHAPGVGVEHGGFVSEGDGFGDTLQALLHEHLTAGALLIVELLECSRLGFLRAWRVGHWSRNSVASGRQSSSPQSSKACGK